MSALEQQISAVALLDDPVRRALYTYVAGQLGDVTRDGAARAVRVSRALAAFHLDKLVAAGLLVASYRRLSPRRGPGAGRPAKLYRRSARHVEISLPERRYELAARLFAESLAGPRPIRGLRDAARRFGSRLGQEARRHAGSRPSRTRLLESASAVLRAYGFEPVRAGDVIRLRNCPFDALARDYRELVCGMNLWLMEGLVTDLGLLEVKPVLDPQPGLCCVAFRIGRKNTTLG